MIKMNEIKKIVEEAQDEAILADQNEKDATGSPKVMNYEMSSSSETSQKKEWSSNSSMSRSQSSAPSK